MWKWGLSSFCFGAFLCPLRMQVMYSNAVIRVREKKAGSRKP